MVDPLFDETDRYLPSVTAIYYQNLDCKRIFKVRSYCYDDSIKITIKSSELRIIGLFSRKETDVILNCKTPAYSVDLYVYRNDGCVERVPSFLPIKKFINEIW